MSNPLSLPQPDMRPGGFIPPGPVTPDPITQMLQTFLQFRDQAQTGRTADAQIEEAKNRTAIAQGTLKLEQEKQKTQQAQIASEQADTDARGGAVQTFLKAISPAIEQHAQTHPELVQGLMGGQQQGAPAPLQPLGGPTAQPMAPPAGAPAQAPQAPAQTIPNWGELVSKMTPSAAAAFVHEDLPNLLKLQDGGGDHAQAIQTGDTVTTYVPGKGFYDASTGLPPSDPKAWKASIERKMQPDELALKQLQLQEGRERILSMQSYRQAIQAQSQTRAFVNQTKDLRKRGMMINQGIMTISQAQNDPDPNNRRVLTTSAIANFIQSADQNAQLRIQMLNYFKDNVDPSVAGKWNVLKTRMLQGTLPKYVTSGLLQHLNNLLVMTQSEFEKQRSGEIKRHPELGNWLPESSEFFTADNPAASGQGSPDVVPPPP